MQFISTGSIADSVADAIVGAVLAVDIFAQVRVDSATRQIRIDGQLTPEQAARALEQAGCEARAVAAETDHEQGGSTCCGSCS